MTLFKDFVQQAACPPEAGKAVGTGTGTPNGSTPKRVRRGQAPNG